MGRMVHLDTGWQTVGTAVQDFAEIKLAATQAGFIHSVLVEQSSKETITDNEVCQIDCKRATGSFTSGSGGGTLTVVKGQSGDASHGLTTIERNNTTQAVVGSGTLENLPYMCGSFNLAAGEWERTLTPELRPPIGPSEAFIVSKSETTAGSQTIRCQVVLEITHG